MNPSNKNQHLKMINKQKITLEDKRNEQIRRVVPYSGQLLVL